MTVRAQLRVPASLLELQLRRPLAHGRLGAAEPIGELDQAAAAVLVVEGVGRAHGREAQRFICLIDTCGAGNAKREVRTRRLPSAPAERLDRRGATESSAFRAMRQRAWFNRVTAAP